MAHPCGDSRSYRKTTRVSEKKLHTLLTKAIGRKRRHQFFLKPKLKDRRVCGTVIVHGRDGLTADLRGDQIRPLKSHPGNLTENLFSARSVAIFPVVTGVKAGFVHINALFRRKILQGLFIRFYFVLIPLFVAPRFFLRVMPRRFKALLTA